MRQKNTCVIAARNRLHACMTRLFLRSIEHAYGTVCASLSKVLPLMVHDMNDDLSPKTGETNTTEHLSLPDLLAMRMTYERATNSMCECFIAKARESKDPVIRAWDVSPLQQFCGTLTEHIHLLTQSLDVLADKPNAENLEERHERFLALLRAAEQQVSGPDTSVLAAMQALLVVEQFNEVAWGLLLALVKDAELQRFIGHFEQACARHHEQRIALQQAYEDVALGLVRRNQLAMKSRRPLKSSITGRSGMLLGDHRHLSRL